MDSTTRGRLTPAAGLAVPLAQLLSQSSPTLGSKSLPSHLSLPADEPSESNKIIYFIPSWGKAQFCPEKVKNLWSWQEQQMQVLWGGKSQELGELHQFLWSGQGFELLGGFSLFFKYP